MIALVALGLGAADAWSHRERPYCPACEFEALRTANRASEKAGAVMPTTMGEHTTQLKSPISEAGGHSPPYSLLPKTAN